jgi:tricorn protease
MVNASPDMKGAREITVKVISKTEDQKLRYLDWVSGNKKKVDKDTEGRVGYVYVPDTGVFGQNELVRQFTPQTRKEAIIVDERFNGGGQVPDRFIELLNRPLLNYWAVREFKDEKTPSVSNNGPKVMIINGWSGSGGDAFPYYFRKAGLGPLVGTRTLGGLIGISGNPGLIDGGFITAPGYAFWNSHGKWDVEGYGVDPDYKVEDLPANLNDPPDPQLDKAIKVITDLLKKNP